MKIENNTSLVFDRNVGALGDEELMVTVAAKATCILANGRLRLVGPDEAWPIINAPMEVAGHKFFAEMHYGRRDVDVHLIGTAQAPHGKSVTEMRVDIQSGSLRYAVDVIGDRTWVRSGDRLVPSSPRQFTEMPLSNDRAFGGSAIVDGLELPDAKNQGGRGNYSEKDHAIDKPLPNLERPGQLIQNWDDRPDPATFLLPMGSTLGLETRFVMKDGVPVSITPLFFQQAVPELVVKPGELGKTIIVHGCSPDGPIEYPLPTAADLPQVWAKVGPHESVFTLPLSSIVLLPDQRAIVIGFQTSFRYLYEPLKGAARGELRWTPTPVFESPVADQISGAAPAGKEEPRTAAAAGSASAPAPAAATPRAAIAEPSSAAVAASKLPTPAPAKFQAELPPSPPPHVFVAQPAGVPTLFVTVQRSYTYSVDGALRVSSEQSPLPTDLELYDDVPDGVIASVKALPQNVYKSGTDVVVKGAAQTYGQPQPQIDVSVKVGQRMHRGRVFGKRVYARANGGFEFTSPEPFETMPLRYENAYGGRDASSEQALLSQLPPGALEKAKAQLLCDTSRFGPYLYPRNASGKGYVCGSLPHDVEGRELPNVEDVRDLLTPERIVCTDPLDWFRQPVPFGVDLIDPQSFACLAMFGARPLHNDPKGPYPEVRMGLLPEGFATPSITDLPPSKFETCIHRDASRCASLGLRFNYLPGGECIELQNIDPRRPECRIWLPAQHPKLRVDIRGRKYDLAVCLYTVAIYAADGKLDLVWSGSVPLKRNMTPGELLQVKTTIQWPGDKAWREL